MSIGEQHMINKAVLFWMILFKNPKESIDNFMRGNRMADK